MVKQDPIFTNSPSHNMSTSKADKMHGALATGFSRRIFKGNYKIGKEPTMASRSTPALHKKKYLIRFKAIVQPVRS
jgi:hypothetical protein